MRSTRSIRAVVVAAAAALSFAAACEDGPTGSRAPAAVAAFSGNGQPGTVGQALANPVAVRVTDAGGDPVEGVEVAFQVASGGGSVQPASARTDAVGMATASWTLGTGAGQQTLTATVQGLPAVTFTAQAAAGAAARLRIQPDSSTLPGLGMAATLQVVHVDQFGNVAGAPAAGAVAWTSLDPAVATAAAASVPAQGQAIAQGPGRARIVAAAGALADSAIVAVVQVPLAIGVEVLGGPQLVAGGSMQAIGTVNDAGGRRIANAPLAWSTSDPAVLTVDASGRITGTGPGTAQLRVQSGTMTAAVNVRVLAPLQASAIGMGGYTSCALTGEGRLSCWGSNHSGQGGWGSRVPDMSPRAVALAPALRFTALSVGGIRDTLPTSYPRSHACAVATDTRALCWGLAAYGQIGSGSPSAFNTCRISASYSWPCALAPVEVAGGISWRTVQAGVTHTCGIATDGTTYCWGANDRGQLAATAGDACPSRAPFEAAVPCAHTPVVAAVAAPAFTSLAAGQEYTCGLTAAGAAWCWGRNDHGQLGDGTTIDRAVPMPVSGGHTFTRLSAEHFHTCGLTSGGAVYCWGRNENGQLGNGTTASSAVPVQAQGGATYTDVSAGRHHTCALSTTGAAWCWGSNSEAQLGISPPPSSSTTPVAVLGGHTFSAVSAGGWHTCGRRAADGIVMCWGSTHFFQLGSGEGGSEGIRGMPLAVQAPL